MTPWCLECGKWMMTFCDIIAISIDIDYTFTNVLEMSDIFSRFTSWWGWQQRWNATFLDQQLSQTGWTLSLRWHRLDNRMSKSKSPPWSSSSLRVTTNIINSNTLFASSSTSMLASAICFSYSRENQPYFAILLKLFPNVFQHLSWMKSFKSTRETLSKVESDSFYFP